MPWKIKGSAQYGCNVPRSMAQASGTRDRPVSGNHATWNLPYGSSDLSLAL
jgi:hypothetical protein